MSDPRDETAIVPAQPGTSALTQAARESLALLDSSLDVSAAGRLRVMVVDDISETLEYLVKLLASEDDMEVVATAVTGFAALEAAAHVRPDIVLMDHLMPDMYGIKATEILSRQMPNLRVVVMSILNDKSTKDDAQRAGARAYLVKPFSRDELMSTIRRVATTKGLRGGTPHDARSLSAEWDRHIKHIERRLRGLLHVQNEEEFIVVQVDDDPNLYIQYSPDAHGGILVDEAVGPQNRPTHPPPSHNALLKLGYSAPDASHGGNYWRAWPLPVDAHRVAMAAIDTLVMGYGQLPTCRLHIGDATSQPDTAS